MENFLERVIDFSSLSDLFIVGGLHQNVKRNLVAHVRRLPILAKRYIWIKKVGQLRDSLRTYTLKYDIPQNKVTSSVLIISGMNPYSLRLIPKGNCTECCPVDVKQDIGFYLYTRCVRKFSLPCKDEESNFGKKNNFVEN